MKSLLVICLLFTPFHGKEKEWIRYVIAKKGEFLYNKTSLKINDDGNYVVWTKFIPSRDSLITEQMYLVYSTKDRAFFDLQYYLRKEEIECEIGKYKLLETVIYNSKNEIIMDSEPKDEETFWVSRTGTIGGMIIPILCK